MQVANWTTKLLDHYWSKQHFKIKAFFIQKKNGFTTFGRRIKRWGCPPRLSRFFGTSPLRSRILGCLGFMWSWEECKSRLCSLRLLHVSATKLCALSRMFVRDFSPYAFLIVAIMLLFYLQNFSYFGKSLTSFLFYTKLKLFLIIAITLLFYFQKFSYLNKNLKFFILC